MLFSLRIVILLSILCLFSVSSYGATGTVLITSPVQTTFPIGKAFSIVGTATLKTDTVPTGKVVMPSCLPDATTASVTPTYFEAFFYQVSAELRYSFDGIDQGLVSRFSPRNIGKQQNFNVVIRQYQMTEGVHTAKVFLRDIYGAACNSFRRPWSWAEPGNVFAITTYKFTVTQPMPTISMTLNKTSLTPCDAETGTIKVTSNDPTPNGGTVTLTFPDGSTASAAFAGKIETLTFADFGLPIGYSGTHKAGDVLSFNASVTTAAGQTASSIATAKVMAGGLTVTVVPTKTIIEPNITWCPNPKYPKCRRFQPLSKRSTPVDINITDSSGTPVDNANIILTVERASTKFGGHDHDASTVVTSTRPLGTIAQVTGKGQGLYTSNYTATEFAAQDNIRAKASFQGCSGEAVSNITSQISWLSLLTILPRGIAIGGTNHHFGPNDKAPLAPTSPDNNHWVTIDTNFHMGYLMEVYALENNAGLQINDSSLPLGGKFDVYGRWIEVDHKTHRRGIDVDIRLLDTQNQQVYPNLEEIKNLAPEVYRSAGIHNGNHIHISFER